MGIPDGVGGPHRDLPGEGPAAVVTDLGILAPNQDGELALAHLHPGVTIDAARAATGWDLQVNPDLDVTTPPTPTELKLLHELDPDKIYLR